MVKQRKGKKDQDLSDDDTVVTNSFQNSDKLSKNKNKQLLISKEGQEEADDVEDASVQNINKREKKKKKKSMKVADNANEDMDLFSQLNIHKSLDYTDEKTFFPKKSAFNLLVVEGDVNSNSEDDSIVNEKVENMVENVKPSKKSKSSKNTNDLKLLKEIEVDLKNKQQSKNKKSKKRKEVDEENLEDIFAELRMEYSGEKILSQTEKSGSDGAVAKIKEIACTDKKKKQNNLNVKNEIFEENQKQNFGIVKTSKSNDSYVDSVEIAKKVAIKNKEKKVIEDETDKQDKKKEAKKKKGKEMEEKETDTKKKGPSKKMIAAMQERLKKIQEEEEALRRQEEEKIRAEEEAERKYLLKLQHEKEKKEKEKQKRKERLHKLKEEGKFLTAKQKADKARAASMLEALKAQGVVLPVPGQKLSKPSEKPKKKNLIKPEKDVQKAESILTEKDSVNNTCEISLEAYLNENQAELVPITKENKLPDKFIEESADERIGDELVKDSWDQETDEEVPVKKRNTVNSDESGLEETETESEESSEEEDEYDSEEENKRIQEVETRRQKVIERIQKRREENEKQRSINCLRAPVVCVMGHVDTGKTKILDKLRRTNVQDGEAGGITQQIGATNVPQEAIKDQAKMVKNFNGSDLNIPGMLIIDTPGHESFRNLRFRGSSICDIAILVVDIMHGLETQTLESIDMLRKGKTPFIVALNKIDRLYEWKSNRNKDIQDVISMQAKNTEFEFRDRVKQIILQFAEQGLNACLYYENPDVKTYVSIVPTSAISGDGMGNLIALVAQFSQQMLAKRISYSEELQAVPLEVKVIQGLGTTIDVILINGHLHVGDTIVLAGTEKPIVTQIRSLLMPQPMRELRVKNAYQEFREVKASQGVKIAAKDLDKVIAGLQLMVANQPDEIEICCVEVSKELHSALKGIRLSDRGVYVQASTLGSLEALLEFLRSSKIPYSGIRIGPVAKRDVMRASIMLEHEQQYACILAFDVKIERDAQDLADHLGVRIFRADIIYHLFDNFMSYREQLQEQERERHKHIAVFPCKLRILPQFIFNSRDPIIIGINVEAGILRSNSPLCVPSKNFLDIGIVTTMEINHKPVEIATKGQELCIKIEPISGESPKMFGRHFDENDLLVSKISRESIDACKNYFRKDLSKADWQLMVELKGQFKII